MTAMLRILLLSAAAGQGSALNVAISSLNATLAMGSAGRRHKVHQDATHLGYIQMVESENLGRWASMMEQSSEQASQAPACSGLLVILAAGLCLFLIGSAVSPYIPAGQALALSVCAVYLTMSVTIDTLISSMKKTSGTQAFGFNPMCVVMLTEASKFALSVCLCANQALINWSRTLQESESNAVVEAPEAEKAAPPPAREENQLTFSSVSWLGLPAAFYALNNVLVYLAIGANSIVMFGVLRDTLILWTGAFWKFAFGAPLGNMRLAGMVVIVCGGILAQVTRPSSGGQFSFLVVWVLLMTMCNAAGSVSNEFALKRSAGIDINIQNMILYSMGVGYGILYLLATDSSRLYSFSNFTEGFTAVTWNTAAFQAVQGLMVSRILKYADSVMKTAAACLRGPILVFIGPLTLGGQSTDVWGLVSAAVVAAGAYTCMIQGPIVVPQPKSA